jgi:transcriptional regulator with GAF, ATPase, and Fis domain
MMYDILDDKTMDFLRDRFGIIGESELMRDVILKLLKVAPTDLTVLITGETGTGKEVFAHALHGLSERNSQAFVSVNCGAIPETLLESELFGHEKGAFTGAVEQRKGFFEVAHKGTIFLDEIGEMPIATQVKLLRILESGEFSRIGSSEVRKVNVRVIAATNRDLNYEVRNGRFRQDLYFRLFESIRKIYHFWQIIMLRELPRKTGSPIKDILMMHLIFLKVTLGREISVNYAMS